MFSAKSEYDRGVNTFSPEGRIFQIEYAMEAIKLGSTAIGVCCPEGVLLAVERRLPSLLMEPNSVEKLLEVDSHVGFAISGIMGDARTLVDFARQQALHHRMIYDEAMEIPALTQVVCDQMINFGERSEISREQQQKQKQKMMARPYGVSLIIAGVDAQKGPSLWYADPSGTFIQYKAKAIGGAHEGAQHLLQEQFHLDMTISQVEKMSLSILKQVMEEKINAKNVEVAIIKAGEMKFTRYSEQQLQDILNTLA